ncbi:hypothetical protein BCV69DRAFT_284255 [Microstroma glucosiphilum]|uniref:D-isomer specific 2-hydroxyacid dehydrogenase NAD-binding domain-containing protein n=1 Tax=Pseudomicrostroma glucosiphilum TaxID=1684307 RepID=A0A316U3Q1_9BASI|nr:hypothetical protein BCV69DRAFT_284255 [Pseudomicrostroma glucosiphilum]PWN19101.1 hypothetical protein BCV69DRAFT_284255 [Pseudomicrostroma glucosiphilum]
MASSNTKTAHRSILASEAAVPKDLLPPPGSIAILPTDDPFYSYHVKNILDNVPGAKVEELSKDTRAIVWLDVRGPPAAERLGKILDDNPQIGWVQLCQAGINNIVPLFERHGKKVWTSAKGSFGQPVAEHALMLTLSLLRNLPKRVRATSWGTPSGISLFGQRVTLVGAGGISLSLISLLEPFNVKVTVLRRKAEPLDPSAVPSSFKDGENLIVRSFKELHSVLPETDVLVIAAALTPDTRNMIGEKELALLPQNAVLVNVARGELVDTDALTASLRKGSFAGAGLDVTAPEPLPADHPLWSLQRDSGASFDKELEPDQKGNLIITPHTADTPDMIAPLLAARFARNAKALLDGKGAFEGLVDTVNGY